MLVYIWIRYDLLFMSSAENIYLLCGGCRPTPQGRARSDRRADHRVSPGAAQHPQRHALTPLDGRLLTLTCLRFEHQDCWSRRTAGLWVAVPCVRSAPHSLRRSSPGHSQPTSSYRCCPYYIPIRPSPPNRADCASAWLGCIRFLCARLSWCRFLRAWQQCAEISS